VAVTSWIIDKSAYVRLQLGQAADRDEWSARISRGLVRLSTITRLELGYSARSGVAGRGQFALPPLALMPIEYLTPAIEDRAFEIQMLLADRGQHRAPSIPDLLIAATAEKAGLTVLSVDKDFDLIAAITNQPVETVAG
jgi:predicted nucleic acid-binding protein